MFSRLKKIFWTIIFLYFFSMMIVMSNGSSFMGRYLSQVYLPVANTVGLNTTWNFFSPDPAHIMYLHYVMHFEDDYGNPVKEPLEFFYPEQKEGSDFRMNIRRHNYMMRFLLIDSGRLEKYFIPWVCEKNRGATSLQVELILKRIPPLDKVLTLVDTPYEDLIETEELNHQIYKCPQMSSQDGFKPQSPSEAPSTDQVNANGSES